jgi:hypothetical protein
LGIFSGFFKIYKSFICSVLYSYLGAKKTVGTCIANYAPVTGVVKTIKPSNNMKNIMKIAGVVAVAAALTQSIQAVSVTGNIGFTGGVTYDTASAGTATEVTSWINPFVTLRSGAFLSVPVGTAATFAAPWTFANAGLNPFWSAGGYTFQLLSSFVFQQGGTIFSGPLANGFVVVDGTGIVSGNGYDPTVMSWSFTSQDPKASVNPDTWTFSASAASLVPDGGSTVMLLGIALSGLALLRKKMTA